MRTRPRTQMNTSYSRSKRSMIPRRMSCTRTQLMAILLSIVPICEHRLWESDNNIVKGLIWSGQCFAYQIMYLFADTLEANVTRSCDEPHNGLTFVDDERNHHEYIHELTANTTKKRLFPSEQAKCIPNNMLPHYRQCQRTIGRYDND